MNRSSLYSLSSVRLFINSWISFFDFSFLFFSLFKLVNL
nr:MAG TPA: hypothetical protein [Caudoviricetes sp.]